MPVVEPAVFCGTVVVFQINQPTRCNNLSNLLLDVYVRLNMFRASLRLSSGAQQLQKEPLILPLERGGSRAFGPTALLPTIKPEAASAVELLVMGVRTPETC